MSIFLYLILSAFLIGALVLSAKYLGKIGLFCLGTIMFVLTPFFETSSFAFLGADVSCSWLFLSLGIFIGCYIIAKYGLAEALKFACIIVCATFFVYFSLFIVYLFEGETFLFAFLQGIIKWIALMLAIICTFVLGLFLKKNFVYEKFSKKFIEFLILSIMFFVNIFVFGIISQIIAGVGFGQMLLNILIGLLLLTVFAGALILISILVLKLNDKSDFSIKLLNRLNMVYLKLKSGFETKNEESEEEFDDIKLEGIFADEEDDTVYLPKSMPKKRPPMLNPDAKKDDKTE